MPQIAILLLRLPQQFSPYRLQACLQNQTVLHKVGYHYILKFMSALQTDGIVFITINIYVHDGKIAKQASSLKWSFPPFLSGSGFPFSNFCQLLCCFFTMKE